MHNTNLLIIILYLYVICPYTTFHLTLISLGYKIIVQNSVINCLFFYVVVKRRAIINNKPVETKLTPITHENSVSCKHKYR